MCSILYSYFTLFMFWLELKHHSIVSSAARPRFWDSAVVVYAVIAILLSACMLMLSYVIIVSCIDAHACIESE